MVNVIVAFIPLIIGARPVVPIWIILVLLLLRGQGGLVKAVAFVSGIIAVRLLQGIVFGFILQPASDAPAESGSSPVVSTLLLVIGILMWITAIKQWTKDVDPDAPPPKWMAMFNTISAPKAFGLGALFVAIAAKQWVFTLGAIGVIADARLGSPLNIIAFLIYVICASLLMLIPIAVYAVSPAKSAKTLEAAGKWLEAHNRVIVIVISVIFGTFFLFKGISGLLG